MTFTVQITFLVAALAYAASVLAMPTHKARADHSTAITDAESTYKTNTMGLVTNGYCSCTSDKMLYRQAWDDLSASERLNYINAVKCLTTKPSRTDPKLAPGARHWWDDFVYSHINQTNFIHQSGVFLPWHRQFIWAWEQTLRNDCGYSGALPYWAWERHTDNQAASPVFQPDAFGGNGAYVPHEAYNLSTVGLVPPVSFPLPVGTGGGCITDGAFMDHIANLGTVTPPAPVANDLYGNQYNPHCLVRDFFQDISTTGLDTSIISELYSSPSIHEFRPLLERSVHPSSHVFLGGDGVDLYTSPNDPVFFLLHAQIDRLWTVWQGQDYDTRLTALDGTVTIQNNPPSENATLNTVMKMGLMGGNLPISHAMSTVDGVYCYMYV